MESISTFFKEENDYLYRKGAKKGEARGEKKGEARGEKNKSRIFIRNLINKLDLSDEQIARMGEISLDFVAEVRLEMTNK